MKNDLREITFEFLNAWAQAPNFIREIEIVLGSNAYAILAINTRYGSFLFYDRSFYLNLQTLNRLMVRIGNENKQIAKRFQDFKENALLGLVSHSHPNNLPFSKRLIAALFDIWAEIPVGIRLNLPEISLAYITTKERVFFFNDNDMLASNLKTLDQMITEIRKENALLAVRLQNVRDTLVK